MIDRQIYNILIVDDEADFRETLQCLFESVGYVSKTVNSATDALEIMDKEYFPIVVTDIMMNGMNGIDFLQTVKGKYGDDVEVIMVTGYGSIETAVETMKLGAFGYFIKSHDPETLLMELDKAIKAMELKKLDIIKDSNKEEFLLSSKSEKMNQVWNVIKKVSNTNANVLILGDSGTGKEIIANQIHKLSKRRDMPFVPVNCQHFPNNLLESELFGHEKGSFTGAMDRRIGKLEQGNGGTIFFDEIGDMSLDGQIKLLRALETKKIERLGSNKLINVDIRVVSATNRDIYSCVREGTFREDFLYRINTIEILVPPLRERKEDLPDFIKSFVNKFSRETGFKIFGIEEKSMKFLLEYDYPGNVRELKNIIERMVIMAESDGWLKLEGEIGKQVCSPRDNKVPKSVIEYKMAKREFEVSYINEVLDKTDNNITHAAELMGLSRRQLFN